MTLFPLCDCSQWTRVPRYAALAPKLSADLVESAALPTTYSVCRRSRRCRWNCPRSDSHAARRPGGCAICRSGQCIFRDDASTRKDVLCSPAEPIDSSAPAISVECTRGAHCCRRALFAILCAERVQPDVLVQFPRRCVRATYCRPSAAPADNRTVSPFHTLDSLRPNRVCPEPTIHPAALAVYSGARCSSPIHGRRARVACVRSLTDCSAFAVRVPSYRCVSAERTALSNGRRSSAVHSRCTCCVAVSDAHARLAISINNRISGFAHADRTICRVALCCVSTDHYPRFLATRRVRHRLGREGFDHTAQAVQSRAVHGNVRE